MAGADETRREMTMAKKLKDEILEPLTDEEQLMHLNRIKAAQDEMNEANEAARGKAGIYRNLIKVAGKRGMKPAAIRQALTEMRQDAVERRTHFKTLGTYLRLLGAPLGHQFEMFADAPAQTTQEAANAETPADTQDPAKRLEVAYAQGFEAGWGGNDKARNRYPEGDDARPEWDRGWDDGQAKAVTERLTPRRKAA